MKNLNRIKVTLLVVIACLLVLFMQVVVLQLTHQADAQSVSECPAGSYEIDRRDGKPLCKLEPTGCPYGDSIPLDSPKCAPNTAEEIQAAQSQAVTPEPIQEETPVYTGDMQGK